MRNILFIETACLILDNARIYKLSDVAEIVTEYGYSFKFLSPYSYMLNPIEKSFSKIKNNIRSRIRMGEGGQLSELIQRSISTVGREDCDGYFRYIMQNIVNCAAELPYTHQ
ncbi:hypothetical protein CDIK_3690 [Cucumispora dikerogammari]|nr:hypothetical protein CDIK_3690 [Cucumispora dikerogammari]